MKVGELLEYLKLFDNDDELEIDIYETISKKYIDNTSDIAINEDSAFPILRIDVEAGKFLNH